MMHVDVRDPAFGDVLARWAMQFRAPDSCFEPAVERFRKRLLTELTREGQAYGVRLNGMRVMRRLVGDSAIGNFFLASSSRRLIQEMTGVSLRLAGEEPRARRWRHEPLEVFSQDVPRFSPDIRFVVAYERDSNTTLERWILLGRAMRARGLTEEGVATVSRWLRRHTRRFRALVDGRVVDVSTVPESIAWQTVGLLDARRLAKTPSLVEPHRRAEAIAAADAYHQELSPRLLNALRVAPAI